jgi:hypothetical protein
VTEGSLESQALLREPRRAPPVGRALRVLLGLVLIAYVTPAYFKIPVPLVVHSLLLMLGLVGIYGLIHIVVSRRIVTFGPCVGALLANGLLVVVYLAGGPGSLILGRGEGALAAVTFPWYLVSNRWRARRSRLRTDGNPRSTLSDTHRTSVSHLLSPGQA